MINTEAQLQHDNEMRYDKVKKLYLNPDGQTTGGYDKNPMLNSIIYEVDFEDRYVKEYSANTITENMLIQVNSYGLTLTMMEGIIDNQKYAATDVTKHSMYIVTKRGQKNIWKTTVGWQLLVQWRYQSESWINLKDLK